MEVAGTLASQRLHLGYTEWGTHPRTSVPTPDRGRSRTLVARMTHNWEGTGRGGGGNDSPTPHSADPALCWRNKSLYSFTPGQRKAINTWARDLCPLICGDTRHAAPLDTWALRRTVMLDRSRASKDNKGCSAESAVGPPQGAPGITGILLRSHHYRSHVGQRQVTTTEDGAGNHCTALS